MKSYNLYGFINFCRIIPGFIYPVYGIKDELYLLEGEADTIRDFIPLKKPMYNLVMNKEDYTIDYINGSNREISMKDKPYYAFQVSEKDIVYGASESIIEFFNKYETDDELLAKEIDNFIDEIKGDCIHKAVFVNLDKNEITQKNYRDKKYLYGMEYLKKIQGYLRGNIIEEASWRDSKAIITIKKGSGRVETNYPPIDKRLRIWLKSVTCGNNDVIIMIQGGSRLNQRIAISNAIRKINKNKRMIHRMLSISSCPAVYKQRKSRLDDMPLKKNGRERNPDIEELLRHGN